MFFSTQKKCDYKIAALVVCLFAASKLSAQITPVVTHAAPAEKTTPANGDPKVSYGHEYKKAEVNFTDIANYEKAHPKPLVQQSLENEHDDTRPAVSKTLPPEGVHERNPLSRHHTFTSGYSSFLPASPAPTDTFESTKSNNTEVPPDTHGDVNGTYCVTAINQDITIQDRNGTVVSSVSLSSFWTAVSGGGTSYDPRVFFDRYTQRWYMETDLNPEAANSSIMLAISKTSDPTGAWFEFAVNVAEVIGGNNTWIDYPTMGYNKNWIVLCGNPFDITGSGSSEGASIFVFNKALLLAGTSATFTRFDKDSSFGICPAAMYDTTVYDEFMTESWDGTNSIIRLWKLSGSVAAPTLTTVGYPSCAPLTWNYQGNNGNDFAPQVGTANKIQTNDERIYDLKYVNGKLWCSHNVFFPYSATANPTRCSIQWWQFDTLANPLQIGYMDDPTNTHFYYFPGIAVNKYNDVIIGMSTSSAATHANAAYAVHYHTDPVDSLRPIDIFRHGLSTYYVTYGGGRNRWGDYSQSSLDTDNISFWTIQETVSATVNYWDTWWAYVFICLKPGVSIASVGSATVCAPATVTLNSTVGDPDTGSTLTYQWNLGGTPIAGATNVTYVATVSGTYNLTVYDNPGCDSTSPSIVVAINPLPAAINGTLNVCTGGTTALTDASSGGTWSSLNTTIASVGGSTGVVTGVSADTSTIVYTLPTGCNVTAVVTVNPGPTATITPLGSTTLCAGGSVTLDASTGAGYTYQWQLGGTNIGGATNSSYIATTGGNYTVIVYQGLCSSTSAITSVTVDALPTVTPIGGATTNVCNGQTIVLTDATSGGTWSSSNTAVATVSSAGVVTGVSLNTVTISYTITNTCGAISATIVVTVNASTVVAAVTGVTDICVGGTTQLSDVTASGVWSSSNIAVGTVSVGGVVTGLSAGTTVISYSVTSAAGCSASSVTTVTVSAPFTAVITPLSSTTFCAGGFVTLDATTGAGFTYQWMLGGVNIAGATSSSYTATTGGNYTVLVSDPGGCTSTSSSVTVTVLGGTSTIPSVTITPSLGDTVCSSTAETFTATPTNGGTTPTYQWYVNGVAAGTGAVYGYTPVNGDIVKVVMISNAPCAFPDSAVNSVMMTVTGAITPSVSITSVHNDTTCVGDTVQYNAVPVYGGTAPTYLWTENGINVATGPSYIFTPTNGDTLIVTMTSNYPCIATPFAVSSIFIIDVFTPTINTLSVSVSQSTVSSGSVDTFTAVANGAGSSPSFQWYINGNPVAGATSCRYITDSLQEGQIVNCLETSSFLCSSPASVFSGGISVTVVPSGIKQVAPTGSAKYNILPNPNKGDFVITGTTGSVNDDNVTIVISDVLGQTIYSNIAVAGKGNLYEHINLGSSLANGNYLVTITSGNNPVVLHVTVDR